MESFPVGRRVAFDPERGRLWVVCPRCRQWNLAPLEERWETLEVLERLYRDTPTRYSTEHIGLARMRDGLDVVRIGEPGRPEYAAWRYGGELLLRRRRTLIIGGVVAVGGAAVLGGVVGGISMTAAVNLFNLGRVLPHYRGVLRPVAHVELGGGKRVGLTRRHVGHARVEPGRDGGWRLVFPYVPAVSGRGWKSLRWAAGSASVRHDPVATLHDDAAVRAAAHILPALNASGASRRTVESAARFVEATGTAGEAFATASLTTPSLRRVFVGPARLPENALYRLPAAVRLGLEMATQEAAERDALEDELAVLEREWREAEEIAAIADDLVLPGRVRRFLRMGRGNGSDPSREG
ncbi:MAG TPA: hypothetical protein VJ957_00550 [Longimicrobiales bacterium]|nr:hypothetical protein [Longimicrobiales bacterium]